MKKAIIFLAVLALLFGALPAALAASDEAIAAAEELKALGVFSGVGTNEDGTTNFDLDREPTRSEAVTMLVRLLGKEAEALAGTWETPFTDVANWAKPYVGYAYANKLTFGTGATTFGGNDTVSATQYLTFVLRAMGYESGTDFQWNRAWELSDAIGMTDGRYNADSGRFLRGDVAIVSRNALYVPLKGGDETLIEALGLAPEPEPEPEPEEPRAWYETDEDGKLFIRTNIDAGEWDGYAIMLRWNLGGQQACHECQGGSSRTVVYYGTSSLSWLYDMPAGTEILSTDFVVLDDFSLLETIVKMIDDGLSHEERVQRLSDHVVAQFRLNNHIRMEITDNAVEFTSIDVQRNEDGTETYTAHIAEEISDKGEYGLAFHGADGSQRHTLTYIQRGDGCLTFTREAGHFGKPGKKGTFYITHCMHRMEEDGDIVLALSRSNGLEYTLG